MIFYVKMVTVKTQTEHCVYSRQTANERVILLIWVDDLIIAANDNQTVKNVKKCWEQNL